MPRRSPRFDRWVCIMLAAMILFGAGMPARADNGPCNCGDGKPCLANQMYFGYYPTVWRRWPGTCPMPEMATPTPAEQRIRSVEPPPPNQEFETKSFPSEGTTDAGTGPGTGAPNLDPGQPGVSLPPDSVQPVSPKPPAPGNPPLQLPPPGDTQKLNQLLPTTSPQATTPPIDPNRLPSGWFPPRSAEVRPTQALQGNWPPLNPARGPETVANYEMPAASYPPAPATVNGAPVSPSSNVPATSRAASVGAQWNNPPYAVASQAGPQQVSRQQVAPTSYAAALPAHSGMLPPTNAASPNPRVAMAGASMIADAGASRISGINPLEIDETLNGAKQPALSQVPGDNPLSKDLVQITEEPATLEPASADRREMGQSGASSANSSSAGSHDVRQASFVVRQPSGEVDGLSSVDPLAVSRSLATPPASAPAIRALPPVGNVFGPSRSAQPISRGPMGQPYSLAAAGPSANFPQTNYPPISFQSTAGPRATAVRTSIAPSAVLPATVPTTNRGAVPAAYNSAQPIAGPDNNPLRAKPNSNGQDASTLVTHGPDLPADETASAPRNFLR